MKVKKKRLITLGILLLIVIIMVIIFSKKSVAESEEIIEPIQVETPELIPDTPDTPPEYNQLEILLEASKQWLNGEEIEVLTNLLYGEARGLNKTQKSAVIWCIFNRLDNGKYGDNVISIATAKNQFTGYKKNRTYKDKNAYEQCKEIVIDVYCRWYAEQFGYKNVGRTLPQDYLWFYGNGKVNKFRNDYKDKSTCWDWSLESPYED